MSIDRWKGTWLHSAPEPGAGRKPREARKPREVRRRPLGKSGPCHVVFTAQATCSSTTTATAAGANITPLDAVVQHHAQVDAGGQVALAQFESSPPTDAAQTASDGEPCDVRLLLRSIFEGVAHE